MDDLERVDRLARLAVRAENGRRHKPRPPLQVRNRYVVPTDEAGILRVDPDEVAERCNLPARPQDFGGPGARFPGGIIIETGGASLCERHDHHAEIIDGVRYGITKAPPD